MFDPVVFTLLAVIGFFAFFLKGVMGTGVGTVMMALATFVIDPKSAVVLVAFVSVFSSFAMLHLDRGVLRLSFWGPVALLMAVGSVMGSFALKHIPPDMFRLVLGCAFLLLVPWFVWRRRLQARLQVQGAVTRAPETSRPLDLVVSGACGFCGGFMAVNAAPLIMYFGRLLNKTELRRLFVLIFTPATIVQVLAHSYNGLFSREVFLYGLGLMPVMALGIYLGNRGFHRIPEHVFGYALAVFLTVAAARLIWQGLAGGL